ncbi:selenide, water dikinase SelD [Bacillus sp. V33-4]|uniref:selenide, water dikinase SelD n=1 Tax=Bacillus sp. V33-4 TaxID=2054169 RepID=UPI000C77592A|nr:selenide, water dikinase SelD [Bacillus sp. V33-4]PLR83670.1 selenide, water dikinase SelD [Bacillus sp. V33-4]
MRSSDLTQVLRNIPSSKDKNIIAGIGEDVFAFEHTNGTIVQSVDIITPVVDDPYQFGAIAVANALSDIYAKGGIPKYGLNIIEFPISSLPLSYLQEMIKGGRDKALEAGVSIVGGHTIDDSPKYGFAVTGFIPEGANFISKSGAMPGDLIFLTKPLGIGIYTTAIDQKLASVEQMEEVVSLMMKLNHDASKAFRKVQINACTDVTGFGLVGHLTDVAEKSNISIELYNDQIAFLPDVFQFIENGAVPEGILKNHYSFHKNVKHLTSLSREEEYLLYDPQTSGGLLIFVSPAESENLLQEFEKNNVTAFHIGKVVEARDARIETKNTIK